MQHYISKQGKEESATSEKLRSSLKIASHTTAIYCNKEKNQNKVAVYAVKKICHMPTVHQQHICLVTCNPNIPIDFVTSQQCILMDNMR